MVTITQAHYKTHTRNAKLTRTSLSADRASYGQTSGTAGVVFRVHATTGRPTLFKGNVTVAGTETMVRRCGVLRVVEAGSTPDCAIHVDGVAAGLGSHAQSLGQARPSRWRVTFTSGTSKKFAGDPDDTHRFHFIPFAHDQALTTDYDNP